MNRIKFLPTLAAAATLTATFVARADNAFQGPPFDFSDAYYLANGIDPATLIGRPPGVGPNSVIDNRDNGPNLNNVRILEQSAAYDQSGHSIFFSVTGLPSAASFTPNSAGTHAMQIAETYKVYEFPRETNAQFSVFPKAQDLIADLRNGYFSNNPLGIWQINIVRFTRDALNTPAGQAALSTLAARNGANLDGRPIVRTLDELDSLRSAGYITIDTPPATGVRWFLCPVLNDPRNGAIAPDAHLAVTGGGATPTPAAQEFINLFNCLQTTGRDDCTNSTFRRSDCDHDGRISVQDIFTFVDWYFTSAPGADFDHSGHIEPQDIFDFLNAWMAGA